MTQMIQTKPDAGTAYRPGVCNIGPAEVERRRRSAAVATAITLLVAALMIVLGLSSTARLALFPFAAATAITWLQVTRRFCVAFGAAGLRNFGPLGAESSVEDRAARLADRRTTIRMILEGLAYAAVVTVAFWLISGWPPLR
jgi:hypothetical protein